jgi:hypothetical protein
MDGCDGIELLGVLAAARERFSDAARLLAAAVAARRPLQYPASGFTANRGAAARAASQARASSATTASRRHGKKAKDSPSTTPWPMPPAKAAAANDPPRAGPA